MVCASNQETALTSHVWPTWWINNKSSSDDTKSIQICKISDQLPLNLKSESMIVYKLRYHYCSITLWPMDRILAMLYHEIT